jgi:sugar lactone lactonase YvrE
MHRMIEITASPSLDIPYGLQRVGTQTDILGECPLWDDAIECLYWVDIRRPAIRRLHHASGELQTWAMPDLVGSIALVEDGRLLVALPQQIALFDPETGQLEAFVPSLGMPEGHRFNDGRCDSRGRFWVGSMHNTTRAPEGTLYCLEGAGPLRPVLPGICIPNSLAFSPEGDTLYFADSLLYRIYAHPYSPATGQMGEARVFSSSEPPAFPDGSAVDAEGFVWNAEFNGSRLLRYAPDGSVDRAIALPVDRPTCCAFGGPDLDILFITSTSQNMSEAERLRHPMAGALMAMRPGVRGLPEPRFALHGPRKS